MKGILAVTGLASFNSKMVRLKGQPATQMSAHRLFQFQNGSIKRVGGAIGSFFSPVFQFQNGSIKSPSGNLKPSKEDMFQFQNGSIKRIRLWVVVFNPPGFNSKMVRLKVRCRLASSEGRGCFNSKMVRLKALTGRMPMVI